MTKRIVCFLIGMTLFQVAGAQNNNIDSLKTVLATATGDQRIRANIELCWEYRFVNADSARQYGMRGLDLARQVGNESLEVEALNNIGVTYEAQGEYNDALRYQMSALELRRKLGDEIKTANTLNNIGIIHDERGDFKEALDYYFQARRIYEKAGDKEKIAMTSSNIGIVLKGRKDFKQAASYYRNAMTIYQELGKKFGVAACYANLGSAYYYVPMYDSSLYYSLEATKAFEELNIQQFLPTTLGNAGMAFDKLGRKKESKEYLLRAISLHEKYDNKKDLSFALRYLSGVHRGENNLAEAEKTATRALDMATKINARQQMLEAHQELSKIYEAQGKFAKALEEFREYDIVKDTLFEEQKTKQIAELQTRYETEKKESEIRFLRQENELQDSRNDRNTALVGALILLVTGLVLFGFMVRNRMALKQKAELEETKASLREAQLAAVITSQEAERKRFAADLHDGLGQLISAVRLNLSKEHVEKRSLDQAVEVLNEMNSEIRNIAFNLMPQVLIKNGLTEALEELATRVNHTEKIRIKIGAYDVEPIHETDKKVALYRVCQEWINNVIKYSGCTDINVQLVQHLQELVITIEDNGNGFDMQALMLSQGNGWKNIQSRLAMIHGNIDIDTMKGRKGTTVVITIPGLAAQAA
ncbi:MAG TPA: tetratricopeptide repeat protein [Cyclobacteriaceae bacterium]|nr:tetratricopeptide repeat protein [Cyclobacteriaceae bacterium]